MGFGYKGKPSGATLRGHLESLLAVTYPRIDLGTARPQYPMMTMGDLRASGSSQSHVWGAAFQHALVTGHLPGGEGGNVVWRAHGAWGGEVRGNNPQWDGYGNFVPKMQIPLWFEIGHKLWPDAGFDYFLAQMRSPDEKVYNPTLFFGLEPIDPAKVSPPAAPSGVYEQRGIAMLRADESPKYWEGPRPAVGLRLAEPYAHSVNDSFAILGYYWRNRPILLNRQIAKGYAQNWTRSAASHAALLVDGAEPKAATDVTTRHGFEKPAKFVSAESSGVFDGVTLQRTLLLTDEYLLDVTRVRPTDPNDTRERTYHWFVHSLGQAVAAEGFKPSSDLQATLYGPETKRQIDVTGEHKLATDATWSIETRQRCATGDASKSKMGKAWYDRDVGVRLSMLGVKGTTVYHHDTPTRDPDRVARKPDPAHASKNANEFGGVSVVVTRKGPEALFIALYEPLERGADRKLRVLERVRSDDGILLGVYGEGIDDRLAVQWRADKAKRCTLKVRGEYYHFHDWMYLRSSSIFAGPDTHPVVTPAASQPATHSSGD